MNCARCGKRFSEQELRPPSLALRVIAFPFFVMSLLHSGSLRREYAAMYCRPCRRQLNFALFFAAFMVVIMAIVYVVKKLR